MRTFVASLIVLFFVSVPAYAETTTYNHDASKEIVLKGKILAFGIQSYSLIMSVKYKSRLFHCRHFDDGRVFCKEEK